MVVGGGSSGCIVAAELSADPDVTVLLLEAGDPAEGRGEALQAHRYKEAFVHPEMMWDRYSVPQPGAGGKRLFVGSGRGMGGSGSVNAMVYTRGAARDWDSWDLDGWRWRDVVARSEIQNRFHLFAKTQPCNPGAPGAPEHIVRDPDIFRRPARVRAARAA